MRRITACLFGLLLAAGTTPLAAAGASEPGVPLVLAAIEQWGIESLNVESRSFDIVYEGGNSLLRGEVYGPPGASVNVTRDGSTLTIRIDEPPASNMAASGSVQLHGPESITLAASTERGSVRISSLSESDLDLNVQSGTASITNVNGDLEIEGAAGGVRVRNFDGASDIETADGDVGIEFSDGTFNVRSERGAIRLYSVSGGFMLRSEQGLIGGNAVGFRRSSHVETGSGRIDIAVVTPMRNLRYELSSDSGSVELRELRAVGRLVFGTGETLVTARSEDGDIRFH